MSTFAKRLFGPLAGILFVCHAALAALPISPELNVAPSDSVVAFNEIHYHPPSDTVQEEWIELHNQMFVDVDLSNWSLDGGVHYTIPSGTIIPVGGYLVIAANPGLVRSNTSLTTVLGPWTGKLSNDGETLTLKNHNGRLMDQISYTDEVPWPIGPDGSGSTLAKLRHLSPSGPPGNWRASTSLGGTPGRTNFPGEEGQSAAGTLLVEREGNSKLRIPTAADASIDWLSPSFDDSLWESSPLSVGYDLSISEAATPAPLHFYLSLDSQLLDGSGNDLNGVGTSITYSTNHPPLLTNVRSADCNGSSSFIQIPDAVDPPAYTLSAWVRFDTIKACSIAVRTDSGGPTASWSHQLRLTGGGKFEHYVFDGSAQLITGTTIVTRSNWYHVVISARNSGTMKLFVNGVQEGTARSVGALWTGGDQWRLGSNSGDSRGFMDGQMADVALWHQELAGSDIARLAGGKPPTALNGIRDLYIKDVRQTVAGKSASVWLRSSFEVELGRRFEQLFLDVQYADGFVAWLNGVEIGRRNAPELLGWDSRATDTVPLPLIPRIETLNLSNHIGRIQIGKNILSIQALSSGLDDATFLLAARLRSRELPQASDPVTIAFHEVPSAGESPFWVELYNYGDTALDLNNLKLSLSGNPGAPLKPELIPAHGYSRVGAESLSSVPHAGDRLDLLTRDGRVLVDSVRLNSAPKARHAENPRGEWANAVRLTPGQPNEFEEHSEIVINEVMYHHAPTFPLAGKDPVYSNTVILPYDSTWRYNNSGDDLGTTWREPGYSDATWLSGPAALGTATGTLPVALKTPVPGNGKTTFYFRTQFLFTNPPPNFDLLLSAAVDDGAIFYLNGTEVHRRNMTNGVVTASTKAITNIQSITLGSPVKLPVSALIAGVNTLAVEVHQAVTNATADFLLAARLSMAEPFIPGTPGVAYADSSEEWIELYNRSDKAVDLTGWRLAEAVDYNFPRGTIMPPDSYLVVAKDAEALRLKFPGISILGDYSGKLSRNSERIRLLDTRQNVANEVRYYSDRPWPEAADGGGSSMELIDPRSDNTIPQVWGASDESQGSSWQHYSVRATAINPIYSPSVGIFNELRVCLLDRGEALIDNVSVKEDPGFNPRELLQNGSFDAGLAKWRKAGTHIGTFSEKDPQATDNTVMHLVATGPGTYLNNLIETTLKVGTTTVPVVAGREYEISFDAKWISGSPLLRWELYYNKVAVTTRLTQPDRHGTPGRRNSRYNANLGPTYRSMAHSPAVPRLNQPITIQVQADDPDAIQSVELNYATVGKAWQKVLMNLESDGFFRAILPGMSSALQVQYFVQGTDSKGAVTTYPPGGTNSRAYFKVESSLPVSKVPIIRALTDPVEAQGMMPLTNLLSDRELSCTFIVDERDVIYGGGIRLHGSMFSRQNQDSVGFNVQFPADQPYKGIRSSVIFRRRDHAEILCRHMLAQSRNVPGNYDEYIYFVSPLANNAGITRVVNGNDDGFWLQSQYDGKTPQVYKMEGIREFQTTDTGGPEGYKVAMPIGWIQEYDLRDQGDDKEQYRWSTLISNHRDQDDYSRFIAMAKVFGMSGTNLQQHVPEVMDVEEWSKVFGLQALCGIVDVYTVENPHNLGYLVRPSDGKVLALQNDWSIYFQRPTGDPLIGVQNLSKIFNLPVYKRVYYGAILDLLNTTFSKTYMTRWSQHYEQLAQDSFAGFLDYIGARATAARALLPKAIPFEILSNGGLEFTTNSPAITLQGRGWIDVSRITLGGASNEISVAWIDGERWETLVGLAPGTNDLVLTAYDRAGLQVGTDSIRVVATITDRPQHDFLRITEINYHPAPPNAAESDQGITDGDDFEFVEIANMGPVPVAMRGVRFTVGIRYTFDGSSVPQLAPGQRLVIVRDLAAFQQRYGRDILVAGAYTGSLDNGGETLRMVDAYGTIIEEIRYGDSGDWPYQADGNGSSLERLSLDSDPNKAFSWAPSSSLHGSPGTVPALLPSLTLVGFGNDATLKLRVVIPGGAAYRLETTADLENTPWTPAGNLSAQGSPRVELLTTPYNKNDAGRYYRLRSP